MTSNQEVVNDDGAGPSTSATSVVPPVAVQSPQPPQTQSSQLNYGTYFVFLVVDVHLCKL